MMSLRHALACAPLFGAVAIAATPCAAQTRAAPPVAAQIDQLQQQIQALQQQHQQQIQALQQQLQNLQSQVNASQKAQSAAASAAPPTTASPPAAPQSAPRVTQSMTNRFGIESANGQYSIALTGRLHLDAGDYISVRPGSRTAPVSNLSSGFNARRARIGVNGKAFGDWTYTFIYDAGNSNDVTPRGIEYAQINYRGFKDTVLDFGYSDTFFTLDEATNTNDLMFMERSTPAVIATLFNADDFRANAGARFFNDRFWLGAYVTGPQQGQSHALTAEQFGAYQRGTYQVLRGADYSLHLGIGVDELLKAPNTGIGTANAITLSDAPELRIDPTAILNTGTLGSVANPVTGATVFNLETAAGYKNLFWQGEYFHYALDRRGLQQANFEGGYGQVGWTLTGESRKYIQETGSYSAIIPNHPFSLAEGSWGAWELGLRLSYINLNDNFTAGLPLASQPSVVAGGKQTSFTLGLNWYVNSNIRFMLNYVHADIDKKSLTAPTNSVGATVDAIALRSQVAW
ncbi:MAG: porin [Rhodospirillales bacterium]|jgi:phosphate-selective porin OprO/OprP|nr:porin [Rhodospirillales bacterium]